MNTINFIPGRTNHSQSALLISSSILKTHPFLKGKILSRYLHRLLTDPLLEKKLSYLISGKLKKQYQPDGLSLKPVFFYPSEEDWAHLSILSNGTGYSRCFIFVFLLLLDLGLLNLPEDRTKAKYCRTTQKLVSKCEIKLSRHLRKYQRKLE